MDVEQEIIDKGLTAPRITMDQLVALVIKEDYYVFPDSQTTVCQLTFKNGFTTIGHSACVSPENFNKELGEQIAKDKAIKEAWPLEAYLLKQQIYEQQPHTST